MSLILQPWQLLLVILAGWVNQQQQQIIDFQRTEIEVLKEKLQKRRIILNDDQRRRLAVKGKVLGRKVLETIGPGGIFGEMALISDEPRIASATAENDTAVEVVSKDEFRSRFSEVNGFVRALIKLLAMNIRSLSDHVESKR